MAATNESLVQPARAQAVWVSLWGITMTWVFFQAARLGDDVARSGLGSYFLSAGDSSFRQLLNLWLACMTCLLPLLLVTVAVCLIGAMPGDSDQARMWVILNLQYSILFLLVTMPLLFLAIALGSRLGGAVGYIVPMAMLLYGLYGVDHLATMASSGQAAVFNWLYILSPHYHLADLTERLIFKHGSMIWGELFQIVGYFVGLGMVLSSFSALYFRAKSAV
ncbi:hypothetical protein HW115_04625 [Verrucomicrobiaceae bacterium N1E253]|uniref:Uncharacterized protein n=1 Tax=Oceaniferula marina TaxID=2748318 RepID=A0A851GGD2_9BACT|nr:hypothetical protein [Oceaniferula marina]NWK54881.1 hypothetical protein [Oceaniferula marina]